MGSFSKLLSLSNQIITIDMTNTVLIVFCSLILIAYLFDLTSSKTKVPSVILLLILGWIVRQFVELTGIHLPDISSILPVIGTLGLILIVLEGSFELELNKSKFRVILKSFFGALLPMIATAFIFAYIFQYFEWFPFKHTLINVIPFCVISSAVAITSVRNITASYREFITYESSFSDILGVIFFTIVSQNETFNLYSIGNFGLQILIMFIISFIATIVLSFLLSKIQHHIKFIPIILLVVLIYSISKVYHLPSLIFILLFGLILGNLDEFKGLRWINKLKPEILNREVQKFKELAVEGSFLVRALFFLLFGYLMETSEILNSETLLWSLVIVFVIIFLRVIQLKLSKLPLIPLLFVAPRGLITILLFLSIEPVQRIPLVNNSLIIQVIVLTALIMMIGLMIFRNDDIKKPLT
jgi:cell volume regulation protein A